MSSLNSKSFAGLKAHQSDIMTLSMFWIDENLKIYLSENSCIIQPFNKSLFGSKVG